MIHGGDIYRNHIQYDFSVNVNPLGVPESVKEALYQAVEEVTAYPDIEAQKLREAIEQKEQVPMNQILCGNGASELIQTFIQTLQMEQLKQTACPLNVLLPVPSFYGYERAVISAGANLRYYKMKPEDGFGLTASFLDAMKERELLILANPNNPVGNGLNKELLVELIKKAKKLHSVVLIDECFLEFHKDEKRRTMIPYMREYKQLYVLRAFTKIYAIPGVRLGYLMSSNEQMLKQVRERLPEWNLSTFAQKAGISACKEQTYLTKTKAVVQKEREYLSQELQALGCEVYPSEANFIFFRYRKHLYQHLVTRGILIRDCSNYKGLEEGYYRVAVKGHQENERFIKTIKEEVAKEWI